jgi:hypothetical protein
MLSAKVFSRTWVTMGGQRELLRSYKAARRKPSTTSGMKRVHCRWIRTNSVALVPAAVGRLYRWRNPAKMNPLKNTSARTGVDLLT